MTIKRIYEEAAEGDGYRILVDRLWPRGISKDAAQINEWCKEIAPSTELRKWFDHQEERYDEFVVRYREELCAKETTLDKIAMRAQKQTVTLLFATKQPFHHAITLRDLLKTWKRHDTENTPSSPVCFAASDEVREEYRE